MLTSAIPMLVRSRSGSTDYYSIYDREEILQYRYRYSAHCIFSTLYIGT
jgi:hypothetical protein